MPLEEALAAMRVESGNKFPAETREKFQRTKTELRDSGIVEKALNIGDKMPAFSLQNTKGEMISSDDLLKNGNLVITFYRGVW